MRFSRVVIKRLTAKAEVATVLGSIPASSDTVKSERWQLKQFLITYKKTLLKMPKIKLSQTVFHYFH
jgi:hypothetical protein